MRHLLHKFICWYLRRCAGTFHCYHYGEQGRYVVLLKEWEYSELAKLKRCGGLPRYRCIDCGFVHAQRLCQLTEKCHNDMERLEIAGLDCARTDLG